MLQLHLQFAAIFVLGTKPSIQTSYWWLLLLLQLNMRSLSIRTLLKLLAILVLLAFLGPYVIGNILFQPTREQLMAKHFKKASIYKTRDPKHHSHDTNNNKPVRENTNVDHNEPEHIARVSGGMKSMDRNALPPLRNNRWHKPNDQLKSKNNIIIPIEQNMYTGELYILSDFIILFKRRHIFKLFQDARWKAVLLESWDGVFQS